VAGTASMLLAVIIGENDRINEVEVVLNLMDKTIGHIIVSIVTSNVVLYWVEPYLTIQDSY
jgi:hypothetical protein